MTVTLTSTSRIVDVQDGDCVPLTVIKCRVWEGETAAGVKVVALIPRIAAHKDSDCSQFEAKLQEQRQPSIEAVSAFPLRLIL